MEIDSVLRKVDRGDFFSVPPAGFYVFTVLGIGTGWLTDSGANGSIDLAAVPGALYALMGSYLIGSLIRAFPVNWADWIAGGPVLLWSILREFLGPKVKTLGKLICEKWRDLGKGGVEQEVPAWSDVFPYPEKLREALEKMNHREAMLTANGKVILDLSDNTISMHKYNQLKNQLLITNEVAYAYNLTFEIRARFCASMVWAGIIGLMLVG